MHMFPASLPLLVKIIECSRPMTKDRCTSPSASIDRSIDLSTEAAKAKRGEKRGEMMFTFVSSFGSDY